MNVKYLGAIIGLFFVLGASQAGATVVIDNVRICHANGNDEFVSISVSPLAIDGIGNGDHNRSGHQDGKDIIPSGWWDSDGRNWDTDGQAIWNNDCDVPTPPPDDEPPVDEPPTDEPPTDEPPVDEEPTDEPEDTNGGGSSSVSEEPRSGGGVQVCNESRGKVRVLETDTDGSQYWACRDIVAPPEETASTYVPLSGLPYTGVGGTFSYIWQWVLTIFFIVVVSFLGALGLTRVIDWFKKKE